jgi:hypothetical protein
MRLSELEQLIAELRKREGDLDVAATVGAAFTGMQEAETEPLDASMIRVQDSESYGPFPGKRYVQFG